MGRKALDLTGQKFGKLTYLKPLKPNKHGSVLWLCECECGNMSEVTTGNRHNTKSCSLSCLMHSKSAVARKTGLWDCPKHGIVKAVKAAYTCFECPECRNTQKSQKRKDLKQLAVDFLGGECEKCGYDDCLASLDFHHIDSNEKDFNIARKATKWSDIVLEVQKCMLLCANCHREFHYGEWEISDVRNDG